MPCGSVKIALSVCSCRSVPRPVACFAMDRAPLQESRLDLLLAPFSPADQHSGLLREALLDGADDQAPFLLVLDLRRVEAALVQRGELSGHLYVVDDHGNLIDASAMPAVVRDQEADSLSALVDL